MELRNLHTHTFRCQHADGDVADYCAAARRAGLKILGMSDHTPLPDDRWGRVRMRMDELDEYCAAVADARVAFPELAIYLGMECEFTPAYGAFYREELLGRRGFDYLIGAVHFFPLKGEWVSSFTGVTSARALGAYAEHCIATMRSGLFDFIAHPDVFGMAYRGWDAETRACSRAILEAAADLDVPLEINSYGMRKKPVLTWRGPRPGYPRWPFWELAAEYPVRVVVNSDAHRPRDIVAGMRACRRRAEKLGLREAQFAFAGESEVRESPAPVR